MTRTREENAADLAFEAWTVSCPICKAKPGIECTSIVSGCVLNHGHNQRYGEERRAKTFNQ